MPGKKFTVDQIVAKLREAEKLQAQGSDDPAGVQDGSVFQIRRSIGGASSTAR